MSDIIITLDAERSGSRLVEIERLPVEVGAVVLHTAFCELQNILKSTEILAEFLKQVHILKPFTTGLS